MLRRCRAHGKATLESLAGRRYGGAPRKGSVLSSWSGRVGERGARASEPHMCATRHPCTALYDSSTLATLSRVAAPVTGDHADPFAPRFCALVSRRARMRNEQMSFSLTASSRPRCQTRRLRGEGGEGARHRVRSDTARFVRAGAQRTAGRRRARARARGRGCARVRSQ